VVLRVVLFSYYFPPALDVGALRARKIADSFLRRGATVDVVSAPLQRGSDPDTLPVGLSVRRLAPSLDLRAFYRRLRGRGAAPQTGASGSTEGAWVPPGRSSFFKRQISAALWLPDDRQGWILPAAKLGTQLVRAGADLIYSTAPPYSVHLAALLVKQRTGVPWVVELRDPWTDNPARPDHVRTSWSDATDRWLERRALRNANIIIAVTDSVAERLKRHIPSSSSSKVIVIRNGIDSLDPPPADVSNCVRRITYAGTLYLGRDPRPFLLAVANLARAGQLDARTSIEFIGDCRWFNSESMEEFVRAQGLGEMVRFVEPLPHAEVMKRLHESDLLLLLAQNQPLQVPNKLYEYLGVRRPILAFVDQNGESASILHRLGGHFVVDKDDPAHVAEIVGRALAGQRPQRAEDTESLLREWTAEVQFDLLQDRLKKLFDR
jgi:glycosyltransferase involved in cell wall biosynthesis